MSIDIDKERADFEAWWKDRSLASWRSGLVASELDRPMPDGWGAGLKRYHWEGWQAARAIPQAPTPAAAEVQTDLTDDQCIELAEELQREWMRKAIAETRTAASLFDVGGFRAGMETACDEIETRMALDGDTLLAAAGGKAERIIEVLTAERDHARAQCDHVFKVMMSVYGLAPSGQNIQLEDGRVMWFKDPNAAETLHMLGRAIHEIPKKLAEAAQVGGVQASSAPDDDSTDQFYPPKAALKREDWDTATRKPKVAAPLPRQAVEGLSDTDRMDWIAKKHVLGASYAGIGSVNMHIHLDDYSIGGARYAIDCMIERDSVAPQTTPDQAKSAPTTTEKEKS